MATSRAWRFLDQLPQHLFDEERVAVGATAERRRQLSQ
jgi:hypothetical protein